MIAETTAGIATETGQDQILAVSNIEVVYDHVILVLKGVSLTVQRGGIVAILGANGAGKTTTLKAISNLLHAERGEVTKGAIVFEGEQVDHLSPNDLVRRGCIQVMEGRHCFGHLSIEENLMTGAFTRRDGKAAIRADLEKIYNYFPRLKQRRSSMAGYTSGGEQQMCAIGRGLMAKPKVMLIDELSLGLAPVAVDVLVAALKTVAADGLGLLVVEQDVAVAFDLASSIVVLDRGRVTRTGTSAEVAADPAVRAAYLGEA